MTTVHDADPSADQAASLWERAQHSGTPLWERAQHSGTPLWHRDEDGAHWATFLHRAEPASEHPDGVAAVHLHINRVTDKQDHTRGYMHHIPGTDLWELTLQLPPTLRACYGFTPLKPGQEPIRGPQELGIQTTRHDPLSSRPPMVAHGTFGLSVLAGPEAPEQPEWETPGALRRLRGGVIGEQLTLPSDGRPRGHQLYLPPRALEAGAASGPNAEIPLLTLFDAETWFGDMDLPLALDAAIAAGRIPEVAVLGIANTHLADRVARLGADSAFLRDVASTSARWAEDHAAAHGIRLAGREGRIIAGQSLGGLSALVSALELPEAYGAAVSHSASMWWAPGGRATPRDLNADSGPDWITERFAHAAAADVRIRLAAGRREGPTVPKTQTLQQMLSSRGWPVDDLAVYDGGHDYAWWRGALLDDLAALLPPHSPHT